MNAPARIEEPVAVSCPDDGNLLSGDGVCGFCGNAPVAVKHIEGPYQAREEADGAWGVNAPFADFGGEMLCFVSGLKEGPAKLFAAAPDLLEALQLIIADFADYPASERPCLAFDKARAAIRKATGA